MADPVVAQSALLNDVRLRQELAVKLLMIVSRPAEQTTVMRNILLAIKEASSFSAVGIRLKQGDDYPYYDTSGFSPDCG